MPDADAAERGEALICLLGHADYYPRFGFVPARGPGVLPPRAWPDASWMALPLAAWAPDMRGTVRFPPAFPKEQGRSYFFGFFFLGGFLGVLSTTARYLHRQSRGAAQAVAPRLHSPHAAPRDHLPLHHAPA
jgi:hypothetical protein